jgi:hypothetical protein
MSHFPDFPKLPHVSATHYNNYISPIEEDKIIAAQIAKRAKMKQMKETMKILNIPVEDFGIVCVPLEKLYDILMDETKMKEIMTKLNNKALW